MRAGEPNALEPVDLAGRAQQLAERVAVTELDTVGVHVLPEQGDFDRSVVDEQPDLVEDVARSPILLFAAQARNDAEGAGVIAPDRDRYPPRCCTVALGGKSRGEDLEGLENLELRFIVVSGPLEQTRQGSHVVRAEDDVYPRRLLEDPLLVHLREASAHRDLHALVLVFAGLEVTEGAVELAGCVVADGAGVDHDDVSLVAGSRAHVASTLERSRQALGVVDVHLTAESAHLVRAHRTRW